MLESVAVNLQPGQAMEISSDTSTTTIAAVTLSDESRIRRRLELLFEDDLSRRLYSGLTASMIDSRTTEVIVSSTE